jgi:peptide/nickel transport system ATP-binding protein
VTTAGATTRASADPLLTVRDLRIESRIGGHRHGIVTGIDLEIAPGETVGIVGESGSGKSMTARALIGLLPGGVAATGEIRYGGRNLLDLPERALAQLRGREIGLIMQDPFTMLSPLLRCGRHIDEALRDESGRKLGKAARRAEAVRRLAEVGIHDPSVAERYPFELSGGMRQRVGIAAALARDPRILIADEPSTALDVTTQKEILALLRSLQQSRGMGLILITHDLRVAFSMCDRITVLYAGSVLEVAPAAAVEQEPRHPYTLGLLLSEPPGDRRLSSLVAIPGSVADPDDVTDVCAFSPRCVWAAPECRAGKPPLREIAAGRLTACVRIEEIQEQMRETRATANRSAHVELASQGREALVTVRDLTKVFDSGRGDRSRSVTALGGVSVDLAAGESVGLVGESGSGKTTLARCLMGLETPSSGQITIDGIDAADYAALTGRDRAKLRQSVQMIFQDPYSTLNPVRTVGATLKEALAMGPRGNDDLDGRLRTLLDRVGLPEAYAGRKPVALSGGERQRIAIARALAVEPKVIVCDEPASALDVSVQAQILNLLRALRAELGISYLFITHDLAVVRQLVERIYVLHRGQVVEAGPVDSVLDDPQDPYTVRLVDSVPRSEGEWLGTR